MIYPSRYALTLLVLIGGCATRPPATDPDAVAEYNANNDPLEPTNRFLFGVNEAIDKNVLRPVAQGYRYVVPGGVRRSIGNALANVAAPIVFANDVLQGKPRRAAATVTRFVVNSTVGLGGFFDVAEDLGLPAHRGGGFGTTLALWGVGDGPFLFLPLLGPSNVRDTVGFGGDIALDPFTWVSFGGVNALRYSRAGVGALDVREKLLDPIDEVRRTSLDPYATFRSVYRQNRAAEIDSARVDAPVPQLPAQAPPSVFGALSVRGRARALTLDPRSPLGALIAGPLRPGAVVWLGRRPGRREAMVAADDLALLAGQGVVGDHYRTATDGGRQVTLIAAEHLAAIGAYVGQAVGAALLRRNIVTSGVNLLALKGRQFRVGTALLAHSGECHPCSKMEAALGPGGYNAVRGHGGITARVIEGGAVRVGDAVAG